MKTILACSRADEDTRYSVAARWLFIFCGLFFCFLPSSAHAQRWTLVDFGASAAATQTPYGDWNQLLREPTYTAFTDPDGNPLHDGVKAIAATPDGLTAYFGIAGTTPIDFQVGQKIIATFFNPTATDQDLNLRLSVTDPDAPDASDGSHPWISMYAISWEGQYDTWITVAAGSLVEAELYITDSATATASNAGTTAGAHQMVNLNIANNNTEVILTRIELSDETDSTAPTAPANLTAQMITTAENAGQTVVRLQWTPATDAGAAATGLRAYLIYRDGELYDIIPDYPEALLSHLGDSPYYRDLGVAPGQTVQYHVTAVDRAPVGIYPTVDHPDTRRGNESAASNTVQISVPSWTSTTLVNPHADIFYQGAFRLPDDGTEEDWAYANRGLTYRPDGNPQYDSSSERPGSLYAVAGLPRGEKIAEITIPTPVVATDSQELGRAVYLQTSVDLWPAVYSGSKTPAGGSDAKSLGIGYHPAANGVAAQVYYTVSNYYGTDSTAPSMGAFELDLTHGQGAWHVGTSSQNLHPGLVAGMVFAAPADWAAQYTGGRSLIVGNAYTPGCGMLSAGPSLYAVAPWESGGLPANGGSVSYVELLKYGSTGEFDHWSINYLWGHYAEGAAWLVDGDRTAVAISGRRNVGDWWYGFQSGDNLCEFNIPEANLMGGHSLGVTRWQAQLMFYDPADLAAVAQGAKQSWEPMPYATVDLAQYSLIANGGTEAGALAYDRSRGYLYYIEYNGDPGYAYGYSIVHAFALDAGGGGGGDTGDDTGGDTGGDNGGDTGGGTVDGGMTVVSGLWLKAVLKTTAGSYTLVWQAVGSDTTPAGDRVVSGYFYADPTQFAYGSQYNPEVFVKIYIRSDGWANIAFNHVTVDDVDVYSAHNYSSIHDQTGTAALSNRLVEHSYTGVSLQ